MRPELKEIADGIVAAVKEHVAKATDDQLEIVAGLEARVVSKMAELEARIAELEARK